VSWRKSASFVFGSSGLEHLISPGNVQVARGTSRFSTVRGLQENFSSLSVSVKCARPRGDVLHTEMPSDCAEAISENARGGPAGTAPAAGDCGGNEEGGLTYEHHISTWPLLGVWSTVIEGRGSLSCGTVRPLLFARMPAGEAGLGRGSGIEVSLAAFTLERWPRLQGGTFGGISSLQDG
jgi:hypothetical protein